MPFAGHPTVGCAVLLAEMKYKAGCSFETEIRLEEGAGLVPVKVSRIGDHPRAQFTAPVVPFRADVPLPTLRLPAAIPTTSDGVPSAEHLAAPGRPLSDFVPGPLAAAPVRGSLYDRPVDAPTITQASQPVGRTRRPSFVNTGVWSAGMA